MSQAYHLTLPAGYRSQLDLLETEEAIKFLKDTFERKLARALNLTRVSAPLFVLPTTGLNDNLSGVERPVAFDVPSLEGQVAEVVHSLAKWKRHALGRYGIGLDRGLYTDMNAIRRDEVIDNIHSLYVDQWDWERVMSREERQESFLREIVTQIYRVFLETGRALEEKWPILPCRLPEEITFLSSQALEDRYPQLDPSQRELMAAREYGAFFLIGIGAPLASGRPHDKRAPDYDDWRLNGDLFFYYEPLDIAMELSSMGIRVDAQSLRAQLEAAGCTQRAQLPFQKALLEDRLPLSVGGGIGQSRLCMYFLQKAHIGEVHASLWPQAMAQACQEAGIQLL